MLLIKIQRKQKKSTHTYTDGQLIVEFEYLIFSCFTHLLLCFFLLWFREINWPIAWNSFINICEAVKLNMKRSRTHKKIYDINWLKLFKSLTFLTHTLENCWWNSVIKLTEKSQENGLWLFHFRLKIMNCRSIFARGTTAFKSLHKPSDKSNFTKSFAWKINKAKIRITRIRIRIRTRTL